MRLIFVLPVMLFCSCTQQRFTKSVEQFMGNRISISADWNAYYKGKDTLLSDFVNIPIKLMVWYDSLGCISCNANKMYMWGNIANYADSMAQWFNIIFLFTPKTGDIQEVITAFSRERFDYPVFLDSDGSFIKQNKDLPKNQQLHSFLLDKNNRVVLVGNPLYNPALWALYKRTIQEMIDNDGVLPDR